MKESKCGKIPPCYGSLEFAIYEDAKKVNDEWKKSRVLHGKMIDKLRAKLMEGGFLDDTHDKVYELNKQMCDIDKHLSEAGYFGMICEGQVEARKKLKDMKEKKTKKMTKAEAFEYFKGKRVVCDNFNCVAIQRKFFEVGIKWRGGSTDATEDKGSFIFVNLDGYLTHCNNRAWFDTHEYKEISAHDILSMEIIDETKSEEEEALGKISCLGAQIMDILLRMKGHHHVTITETTVALHDEGMSLFHSDPF